MKAQITDKERKHFDQIIRTDSPLSALLNRVIVVQVRQEHDLIKDERMSIPGLQGRSIVQSEGGLFLPVEVMENLEADELVKAVVKSIGPLKDGRTPCVEVNDVVLVFPNVFETKVTIEGLDYFIYGEADLVARLDIVQPKESIYDNHSMD